MQVEDLNEGKTSMNFLDFLVSHFSHAAPLLITGVFAIAIVLERANALFKVYPMKNTHAFFEKIQTALVAGKPQDAVALCDQNIQKPVARIAKSALMRIHMPENLIEHGIELTLGEVTHAIQKRTSFLATIANVATLLGLFGTIAGLISSFEAVGHADPQQKSALLAAGIATAMNATMLGLGIAIPAMVAFSFLMNRASALTGELENGCIRILDLIKQSYFAAESFESDVAPSSRTDEEHATNGNGKVVPLRKSA